MRTNSAPIPGGGLVQYNGNSLVQDYSISIANSLELPQSCTKQSKVSTHKTGKHRVEENLAHWSSGRITIYSFNRMKRALEVLNCSYVNIGLCTIQKIQCFIRCFCVIDVNCNFLYCWMMKLNHFMLTLGTGKSRPRRSWFNFNPIMDK